MKDELLYIFGYSDYALLVSSYFKDTYKKIIYIVDDEYHLSFKHIKKDEVIRYSDFINIPEIKKQHVFVAVGYRSMRNRQKIFEKINALGVKVVSYISPNAIIDKTVTIGQNNIIFPGVLIEPKVKIGDNNIIWSSATICHDTIIETNIFIAANVTIAGNVKIGSGSFLGLNATVIQNILMSEETLLAACALLTQNTKKGFMYCGLPAKKAKDISDTGIEVH